jgi:hypothetical protein
MSCLLFPILTEILTVCKSVWGGFPIPSTFPEMRNIFLIAYECSTNDINFKVLKEVTSM